MLGLLGRLASVVIDDASGRWDEGLPLSPQKSLVLNPYQEAGGCPRPTK